MLKRLLFISFILSYSLLAQEIIEDDLGGFDSQELTGFDEIDGFDEDTIENEVLEDRQTESSNLSISGNIAFKTSYGYKEHSVNNLTYSKFNQAQTSLFLQLDYKLSDSWKLRASGDGFYDFIYDIQSNKNYPQNVLDSYQRQLRLDDTYIQGKLSKNIDLKVGRQIVVWGKSDSIRVTDVINPLDNRLPGLTDIEDLRLSTAMIKADYYFGNWALSTMIIGESRIFLEASPRGEFFPVEEIFPAAPNPFFALKSPESSWTNTQFAFSANGVFSGWDLSFYAADVLDQKWHLNMKTKTRVVSKVKMLGSALNIAKGSFLLKSEIAYLNGVKYNSTQNEKDRVDLLVGFDYMGIKDTVISLEIANRHIFNYESQMYTTANTPPDYINRDELQTAFRATSSFANDTINLSILANMFGHSFEYGGFTRVWAEYSISDALNANIGIVDYIGGDRPFMNAIENNDRLFGDVTYSF